MKNLAFNFTVDKEKSTIHVEREFAADLDMVWSAWTNPAILDLWWAPKPYQTKTKSMDFRVGGFWLYSMISPEGEKHWCRADYKSIDYQKSFSGLDAFCDEEGHLNSEFPRSLWNNLFHPTDGKTKVTIAIEYSRLEDLEKIIELGFKEGFMMAMGNLDQYFASLEKK